MRRLIFRSTFQFISETNVGRAQQNKTKMDMFPSLSLSVYINIHTHTIWERENGIEKMSEKEKGKRKLQRIQVRSHDIA